MGRLEHAAVQEDADEIEHWMTRLPHLTDAHAACRFQGVEARQDLEEWRAYWHLAKDRPQRREVVKLGVAAEGDPRRVDSLRRALSECLVSGDPYGPHLAAEVLRRWVGRIQDAGLSEARRQVLQRLRPRHAHEVSGWLRLWEGGPPTASETEAMVSDDELLEVVGTSRFVHSVWFVYRRNDVELGPLAWALLERCTEERETVEKIRALKEERAAGR